MIAEADVARGVHRPLDLDHLTRIGAAGFGRELNGVRQKIRKYVLEPNRVANDSIFEMIYHYLQVDILCF